MINIRKLNGVPMADTSHTHETKNEHIVKRGLLMLLFAILFGIAESLLVVMTLIQFFWTAISGRPNVALVDFGAAMSDWLREVARYQTMKSDDRPFPWGPWPKGE